jgi:lysozyme family protein
MPSHKTVASVLDQILKREGWPAYSNRAADRGGPTKGGVTLETLQDWRGLNVGIDELKLLSETEARAIYRERYLKPWEFIVDDLLFEVVVDYAVTSGHDDPTRALQTKLGVTVDGVLGKMTRAAVSRADPELLRLYVIGYRARHMVNLALEDPKLKALIKGHNDLQVLNLRGWISRTVSFLS